MESPSLVAAARLRTIFMVILPNYPLPRVLDGGECKEFRWKLVHMNWTESRPPSKPEKSGDVDTRNARDPGGRVAFDVLAIPDRSIHRLVRGSVEGRAR